MIGGMASTVALLISILATFLFAYFVSRLFLIAWLREDELEAVLQRDLMRARQFWYALRDVLAGPPRLFA
jgi:hypothetical protein